MWRRAARRSGAARARCGAAAAARALAVAHCDSRRSHRSPAAISAVRCEGRALAPCAASPGPTTSAASSAVLTPATNRSCSRARSLIHGAWAAAVVVALAAAALDAPLAASASPDSAWPAASSSSGAVARAAAGSCAGGEPPPSSYRSKGGANMGRANRAACGAPCAVDADRGAPRRRSGGTERGRHLLKCASKAQRLTPSCRQGAQPRRRPSPDAGTNPLPAPRIPTAPAVAPREPWQHPGAAGRMRRSSDTPGRGRLLPRTAAPQPPGPGAARGPARARAATAAPRATLPDAPDGQPRLDGADGWR
eukprot:scaffold2406_cov363-Prasinococcus_capsulatus_cf.AAC.5